MALRRNRKIIGEIRVERRGKWTHAEATLCNGGIIFASARRSRKETCSHKLGRQVVLGRLFEALKQHRKGGKIKVKWAGYEAPLLGEM